MRIAVAGFMHESNTANPRLADRAAYEAQGLAYGEDVRREWASSHHEVGGFLAGAALHGYQAVPLVMAWATPSGPVEHGFFEETVEAIAAGVEREKPDGLLLALHGAMVTTGSLDPDAEILSRLRTRLGEAFPLAVTFDLHANVSSRLGSVCRLATSYRTNPHLDQRETGLRAAGLLVRWIRGEISPRLAVCKPPMITNIMRQDSAQEPFKGMLARTQEAGRGVLCADFLPGFAYSDVPQVGPSFLVTAEDASRAQDVADALGAELWAERARWRADLPNAAEAVRQAIATSRPPAVIVDTGDNVGGGSAANSTAILAELLRQKARDWVVMLFAPDVVPQCSTGATVRLRVGDPAVEVSGIVRLMHDGKYTETQARHGGKRENHMGPTALLETPEGGLLALTTLRHPPFSLGALTCLGIEPAKMRILVVKAAIAYKAAYGPVGGEIIEAATPGLTAIDPHAFPYKHARRPLWPVDA